MNTVKIVNQTPYNNTYKKECPICENIDFVKTTYLKSDNSIAEHIDCIHCGCVVEDHIDYFAMILAYNCVLQITTFFDDILYITPLSQRRVDEGSYVDELKDQINNDNTIKSCKLSKYNKDLKTIEVVDLYDLLKENK